MWSKEQCLDTVPQGFRKQGMLMWTGLDAVTRVPATHSVPYNTVSSLSQMLSVTTSTCSFWLALPPESPSKHCAVTKAFFNLPAFFGLRIQHWVQEMGSRLTCSMNLLFWETYCSFPLWKFCSVTLFNDHHFFPLATFARSLRQVFIVSNPISSPSWHPHFQCCVLGHITTTVFPRLENSLKLSCAQLMTHTAFQMLLLFLAGIPLINMFKAQWPSSKPKQI